ncbi:MAG: hypothetical protein COZ34_04035 [Candidatus Pacebacteria bacterium CG_4_10_14_3_um_filter_34_15]|nr:tetratricopeptide repeat protein [Candidatus Paceibacterota bacterium]OIO44501.1 MAG: hypothetical protein AUJ41_02525 [Candidatus Pacebacteria bacterium CG1_02_43_31]PIQ80614.1 MAG: hypothetical protein COV78_04600 [Candidatus Pacebacteria bacterium CG11_big_fil_rev_8_21_14_0_20_34_55]PIX81294.1 MAG: hypothetical protein COZ34_04035 [Candidatus Pacebacteria bacterium CG_4_10_14_3_um_filter_34_15]PJC43457.1 MAG: hypothetical protein CO039_04005 [Candidatus Pacebacteria bacterium CG_4_9_14_0_
MSFSKIKLIGILLIIGLLAYLPSLKNSFLWDDEQFIYNNSYVKNFELKKIFTENTIAGAGETSSYYRPLTTLSFAIDHQIWGLNPIGFHLTNTLLHVLTGIILFTLLIYLGISKNASFWISAIFLAHPIQTEAVVYANSRGDSIYAFWSILGLLTFSLLCQKKYPKFQIYNLSLKLKRVHLTTLTIIFYLLSILSKEIGIALLGLFFLTFLSFNLLKIKKMWSKNKIQIFTLGLLTLTAFSYLIFRNKILNISTSLKVYDPTSPYGSSIFVRLHTFTKSLWDYFQFIFWPYKLHMERNLEIINQPVSIWLIVTLVLIVFVAIIGFFEFKKQKTIFTLYGFLWFLVMLVPVSGIIPVNGLIYEHWLYMPIIGFMIFMFGVLKTLFKNRLKNILKYFLPIILAIYIILTIKQNSIWSNPIKFYNYTLAFSQTARMNNNLAMAYAQAGENQKAVENYKKAIEISDYYPQIYHNLGNTYLDMGEIDLAEQSFKTAILMNNSFFPAYGPLINILLSQEKYDQALPLIKNLINNSEFNFTTNLVYLNILYKTENTKEAEELATELKSLYTSDQRALNQIEKVIKKD